MLISVLELKCRPPPARPPIVKVVHEWNRQSEKTSAANAREPAVTLAADPLALHRASF